MAVDPGADSAKPASPQTWNRYAYVSNNPLAYVDPDGREQTVIMGGKTYMGGVDGMPVPPSGGPPGPTAMAIESGAKAVSKVAGLSTAMAGTMALTFAAFGVEPVAAVEGSIAAVSGAVKIGADVVAAMANPGSSENQRALAVGAAETYICGTAGAVVKSVGASQPVVQGTEALTGAIVGAMATGSGPSAQQAPCSGGSDTRVDRAIADKEARAAKGPEPKRNK